MARPVTLFTGQWADLPLEELAQKTSEWGFDGLELACWGDHFEVDKALEDDGYVQAKRALLDKYGQKCFFHQLPPGGAVHLRPDRRASQSQSCRRVCGATATLKGCASAVPRR